MTHTLIFVDDEPNLLGALRRLLHSRHMDWKCHFVTDPREALRIILREPVDVVVSDMRMPVMDGAEFLSKVKALRPGIVRIVLSGHSKQESVVRVVGPAHQYLAKPCEPRLLYETIERALRLRAYFADSGLHSLVGALNNLPSPAEQYEQLLSVLDDPDSSVEAIAAIVRGDVAMVTELLKLTNSQYFALATKVTSVEQAVRILGVDIIRLLVMQIGIFARFANGIEAASVLRVLSDRALKLSSAAARVAKTASLAAGDIQLARFAGMLAEVGVLVLLDLSPTRYLGVIAEARATTAPLLEVERRAYGMTHVTVGAYLLGLWGFHDDIVWAVAAQDGDVPSGGLASPIADVLGSVLMQYPLLPELGITPPVTP